MRSMRSPCLPPVFCPGSRWFTRGWWTLNSWSCGRTWCGRRAKRRGSNQVMRNSKNHQKGTMICELVCNIYVICNIYIYIIGWKKTRTHTHTIFSESDPMDFRGSKVETQEHAVCLPPDWRGRRGFVTSSTINSWRFTGTWLAGA